MSRLRFLRLAAVLLLVLSLSACKMRTVLGVEVVVDGSGTLAVTMALDEEFRSFIEENSDEPIDWSDPASFQENDLDTGFSSLADDAEVTPYSADGFEGFTMSVGFGSLDELAELVNADSEEAFPFVITSPSPGRFELNTVGDFLAPEEEMGEIPSEFLEMFDIQVHVKLPGKVTSHNADEVASDGTLIWHVALNDTPDEYPAAVAEVSSGVTVVVALAVLAAAAAALAVWLRRRNNPPAAGDGFDGPGGDGGTRPSFDPDDLVPSGSLDPSDDPSPSIP